MENNIAEQRKKWFDGWASIMVEMWQERFSKFHIHMGSLFSSIKKDNITYSGVDNTTVKVLHSFLGYGIYVDMGTGREFGGDRAANGRLLHDVKRKAKPWFSLSWYRSVCRAREYAAASFGIAFKAIMATNLRKIAKEWAENKRRS